MLDFWCGLLVQEVSLRCSCAHDFNNLFNFVLPLLARCGRGVEESGKCFKTGYRMQKKLAYYKSMGIDPPNSTTR